MRFTNFALLGVAIVLGACGGDKGATNDTAATATTTPAATPAPGPQAPSAAAGTAAPITGTTHEVKMIGDAQGYRFEPANLTIKAGDGVKWIMVSGGPHNVHFDQPLEAGKAQLAANMPNQQGELNSPMFMNTDETYTVSFANVAPGDYGYVCTPHAALGMRGKITVTQ
ncbi:MAG: plastocyanin/azurin family copper-binding protein [Gemmatimonadaceae bacterium]